MEFLRDIIFKPKKNVLALYVQICNRSITKSLKLLQIAHLTSTHSTHHRALSQQPNRTFATFTLKHTKDIRLVSKLLGHSDVRTTEIYLDEKQELELEAEMLADMEGEYRGGDRGGDALQKL